MLVNCFKDADNSFKVYFCNAHKRHNSIPETAHLVSSQPIERWQSAPLYRGYNIFETIQRHGVCIIDHKVNG
ncbi:hypothetical protein [Halodesulfovibrio aestuarii]|uniref:Uncharacterized protein n=1 Tax=Halodesulfovibrio aestuarii TaxID=126333 RepID=A0A8G2FC60_9BACT|nr:hypothetical protein [Halodesulfovibrio aestuarii]SHJ67885.1 hypothetical protein SAMN05660830_02994 [Halodesulfovibrio aestuarii]